MRVARLLFALSTFLGLATTLPAQQPAPVAVQRDPQAVALLQRALVAMGAAVPTDSVATGTVEIVEGSKTERGSIRILTRGADQTVEDIQTPDSRRSVVYSRGLASEGGGTPAKLLPMELAVTSQCPDFPLPLVASVLNNPEAGLQYIGLETLEGARVHHVRVWSTFASKPKLQKLAEFSAKNIWIDVGTGLPLKIAFSRHLGGGSAPAIPVEVLFSDYRNVGGVAYPFHIAKSFNGTPWTTITIDTVGFNRGLAETDFQIPVRGAR
jgi:hypothetical protein